MVCCDRLACCLGEPSTEHNSTGGASAPQPSSGPGDGSCPSFSRHVQLFFQPHMDLQRWRILVGQLPITPQPAPWDQHVPPEEPWSRSRESWSCAWMCAWQRHHFQGDTRKRFAGTRSAELLCAARGNIQETKTPTIRYAFLPPRLERNTLPL